MLKNWRKKTFKSPGAGYMKNHKVKFKAYKTWIWPNLKMNWASHYRKSTSKMFKKLPYWISKRSLLLIINKNIRSNGIFFLEKKWAQKSETQALIAMRSAEPKL